ncbi:MAG: IscS subfamily cysteine desulfurase, partial [Fidelibacterota bacterium]
AASADVVLPATTMFEINSYMVYGPIFRLREKVIEPVGEARNDYLIMAELARRLGYGHLYPQTEDEMIRFALEGSGYTVEGVKAAGGWVKLPTPMMEYRKWQKGSLRKDGKPGFDTPTGKFEIWSTVLENYGYEPLPKYTEPTEGPRSRPELAVEFPLVFNSGGRPHTDFRSQHHGIEGLVKDSPEPTVEIHEEDAQERGIATGDLVDVRTPRGAVHFRTRVTGDIVRGTVECNMGGGTAVGPRSWREWNVNELTDIANTDSISGFPVYKALLCDVVKVENATDESRYSASRKAVREKPFPGGPGRHDETPKREIYLDNNATTKVGEGVEEAMLPYLEAAFGNPSTIHETGRRAREGLDHARRSVAKLIHAKPRRIIFTAGGSEADNFALKGVAYALRGEGDHIITTRIEHPAILNACKFLERTGFRVTYLEPDAYGLVPVGQLEKAITNRTLLVSVMMANNEVGTIQPIKELCSVSHEKGVIFHTDAVQAVGKIDVDVQELDVDLLSLSGHKFHGPKGVGALYVKRGIRLEPLIHGGKQESGLRAGTENVPAIVGLGKAAEIAVRGVRDAQKIQALREKLTRGIEELIPGARLNGHPEKRLPNTVNLTLPGLRGESLVLALDHYGIRLSSGSACKSGSPEPTHVLIAMGRSEEEAHCAVRFSLSHETTEEDIDATLWALAAVLEDIETTVRFLPCK